MIINLLKLFTFPILLHHTISAITVNPVVRLSGQFSIKNINDESKASFEDYSNRIKEIVYYFTSTESNMKDIHFLESESNFYVDIVNENITIVNTLCKKMMGIWTTVPNKNTGWLLQTISEINPETSTLFFDACINVFEKGYYVEGNLEFTGWDCSDFDNKIHITKKEIYEHLTSSSITIKESQIHFGDHIVVETNNCKVDMEIVQLLSEESITKVKTALKKKDGKLTLEPKINASAASIDDPPSKTQCGCLEVKPDLKKQRRIARRLTDSGVEPDMDTVYNGLGTLAVSLLCYGYTFYKSHKKRRFKKALNKKKEEEGSRFQIETEAHDNAIELTTNDLIQRGLAIRPPTPDKQDTEE